MSRVGLAAAGYPSIPASLEGLRPNRLSNCGRGSLHEELRHPLVHLVIGLRQVLRPVLLLNASHAVLNCCLASRLVALPNGGPGIAPNPNAGVRPDANRMRPMRGQALRMLESRAPIVRMLSMGAAGRSRPAAASADDLSRRGGR